MGFTGARCSHGFRNLQHARNLNIIFVGILDNKEDEYGRSQWLPQIEGSKVGRELPGIVDEVLTLQELSTEDGVKYRGLVCTSPNTWGYPAKDRSGRLSMIEKPHLGELFAKIRSGKRVDVLSTELPEEAA